MAMELRDLGSTGIKVSPIGMGAMRLPLEGGATRTYTYISGKWGYVNGSGVRVKEDDSGYLPIQLGTGFWYVTASTANSITITW